MFSIKGGDGKDYGPVTVEQIREWISANRANLQTPALRVGETEWRMLGDYAEFAPVHTGGNTVPPPPPAPPTSTGPVDAKAYANELIARTPLLNPIGCLSRSLTLWTGNFWATVGATAIIMVIAVAIGLIPFLGSLAGFLINGVLYGGLFYFFLGKIRSQPREVGDAFAGFSRAPGPLIVGNLLISLLTIVIVAISLIPALLLFFVFREPGAMPGPNVSMILVFSLCILPAVYFSIAWAFTFALIIDKGLPPWTAMEVSRRVISRQWFRVFAVILLGTLVSLLGMIGLFVGIIFTLPILFGAMMYAYEDLCCPTP
ncbi:MAG TPA: hypothetical protein PLN52_06150 [Opitutaceae bacterium]|nr:hypothetical protein [Opitutaceae bacterium]